MEKVVLDGRKEVITNFRLLRLNIQREKHKSFWTGVLIGAVLATCLSVLGFWG